MKGQMGHPIVLKLDTNRFLIPYLILGELIMMTLELVVVILNPIFYISTSHSMSKISLLLHYLLIENLGPHMSEC